MNISSRSESGESTSLIQPFTNFEGLCHPMSSPVQICQLSCFLETVALDNVSAGDLHVQFQVGNYPLEDVADVSIDEESLLLSPNVGLQMLTRIDGFNAFQDFPFYIFFQDKEESTVAACGFDISRLIVHSYRKNGAEEFFQVNLQLYNCENGIVGETHVMFSAKLFISDLEGVVCISEPKEEPHVEEPVQKVVKKKSRKQKVEFPMVNPRLTDIYLLNRRYAQTRTELLNEIGELVKKVRKYETQQTSSQQTDEEPELVQSDSGMSVEEYA